MDLLSASGNQIADIAWPKATVHLGRLPLDSVIQPAMDECIGGHVSLNHFVVSECVVESEHVDLVFERHTR